MNTFANEMIVNVLNVVTEEKFIINCDIYAVFLFQRIKQCVETKTVFFQDE